MKIAGLVILFISFCSISFADDFVEVYCHQEPDNPMISTCTNWKDNANIYKGSREQFIQECQKRGYYINQVGPVVPEELVSCNRYLDSCNNCVDSSDCVSGWCKPIDENCQNDCLGVCSGMDKPDKCDPIQKISEINKGKSVSIEIGGEDCSGRMY